MSLFPKFQMSGNGKKWNGNRNVNITGKGTGTKRGTKRERNLARLRLYDYRHLSKNIRLSYNLSNKK